MEIYSSMMYSDVPMFAFQYRINFFLYHRAGTILKLIQYPFFTNDKEKFPHILVMKAYGIRKLEQEQKWLLSVKICILP